MAEQEDVRPLSPMIDGTSTGDSVKKTHRRRSYKRCCIVCVTVTVLFLITIALILVFTVFQAKQPIIVLNNFPATSLEAFTGTPTNVAVIVDVSVKNPNAASFKYKNTTTEIYYRGTVVGEARGPPGRSRARRTTRMNVTVDIYAGRLLSVPSLGQDIGSGLVNMTTYSRVVGRVKILGFLQRHAIVKMNCTVSVNIMRRIMQEYKCKSKAEL